MYAKQLLLKKPAELENGRVPLYVCNCCADIGCGAVTVKVVQEGDYFVWSSFGYENNYEEGFRANITPKLWPIADKQQVDQIHLDNSH